MPIIQLDFGHYLNTSVQIGDIAYFANTTAVGPTGDPAVDILDHFGSSTGHIHDPQLQVPPHETASKEEIIKIGKIIAIIPFDGTKSSIQCDMPQDLFNKYFNSIVAGGCVVPPYTPVVPSGAFSGLTNITSAIGMFDADMGPPSGITHPSWPGAAAAAGSSCTSPNRSGHIFPNRPDQQAMSGSQQLQFEIDAGIYCPSGPYATNYNDWYPPIRWFFDDPSRHSLRFDQYVFVNWASQTTFQTFDPTFQRIKYYTLTNQNQNTTLYPPPELYTVQDIIDYQSQEYANGFWDISAWLGLSSAFNGMNFLDWICGYHPNVNVPCDGTYSNFPGYPRLTGEIETGSRLGILQDCTQGSFIMFSKDNKANQSDLLGYYASVEYRNNSTTEAELYNVGTSFYESSK
jgi:hypothetical protein